jgi:cell division protease FtsH
LVKVTIVPRGQSLGAAWYLPEERSITTTEQLLDDMCATLGGRAAEQITFNRISTGALSDLERVTKQAYAMTSIYGLNERVGNISFYDSQGRDAFTKPYSDDTAKVIDEEVSKLIEGQYQRALQLLGENQDKLAQLADRLLTSEVIFKEDLEAIFGKRQWDPIEELNGEVQVETVAPADSSEVNEADFTTSSNEDISETAPDQHNEDHKEEQAENPTDA